MKKTSMRLSYIEGWLSISANTILFLLKFWAGTATASIAIIADAWHTLSDSLSSVIVLLGAKISSKPSDREHPFGHGRAELVASLIIGVLLLLISFDFFEKSILVFKDRIKMTFQPIAIIVIAISVVVKESMARFAYWAGKKTGSTLLTADAHHHRSDAWSSLILLIGIFLGKYLWWIDGAMGLMVVGFILFSAYTILRDSINPLLGSSPDQRLINSVRKICQKIAGKEAKTHHFHIHQYGSHTELTFHLNLKAEFTLKKAHTIASYIEQEIMDQLNINATIHMEPLNE